MLLGVRAVIAKSFERIHRSNLIGMGVLPLMFEPGQDAASLGLTGNEVFEIDGIAQGIIPKKKLTVRADGKTFTVIARVDTPQEVEYIVHGGILQYVLRQRAAALKWRVSRARGGCCDRHRDRRDCPRSCIPASRSKR